MTDFVLVLLDARRPVSSLHWNLKYTENYCIAPHHLARSSPSSVRNRTALLLNDQNNKQLLWFAPCHYYAGTQIERIGARADTPLQSPRLPDCFLGADFIRSLHPEVCSSVSSSSVCTSLNILSGRFRCCGWWWWQCWTSANHLCWGIPQKNARRPTYRTNILSEKRGGRQGK